MNKNTERFLLRFVFFFVFLFMTLDFFLSRHHDDICIFSVMFVQIVRLYAYLIFFNFFFFYL